MWLVSGHPPGAGGPEAERREERCRRQASAQRSGWLPRPHHRPHSLQWLTARLTLPSPQTHFHASGGPALHMDRIDRPCDASKGQLSDRCVVSKQQ